MLAPEQPAASGHFGDHREPQPSPGRRASGFHTPSRTQALPLGVEESNTARRAVPESTLRSVVPLRRGVRGGGICVELDLAPVGQRDAQPAAADAEHVAVDAGERDAADPHVARRSVRLRAQQHVGETEDSIKKRQARAAKKRLAGAEKLLAKGSTGDFYAEVERALTGFMSARLGLAVAGLTRDG